MTRALSQPEIEDLFLVAWEPLTQALDRGTVAKITYGDLALLASKALCKLAVVVPRE